jgi:hypothetical protein
MVYDSITPQTDSLTVVQTKKRRANHGDQFEDDRRLDGQWCEVVGLWAGWCWQDNAGQDFAECGCAEC